MVQVYNPILTESSVQTFVIKTPVFPISRRLQQSTLNYEMSSRALTKHHSLSALGPVCLHPVNKILHKHDCMLLKLYNNSSKDTVLREFCRVGTVLHTHTHTHTHTRS